MGTADVLAVIDRLARAGTKGIALSGGEPLLRCDIGEILRYCSEKGLCTKVTTNGSLVPQSLNELRWADFVRLSWDGPRDIHDFHRQPGSYDSILDAAKLLKKEHINVAFSCVLSNLNVSIVGRILEDAKRLDMRVYFQPLEPRGQDAPFAASHLPTNGELKSALQRLISEKQHGNRWIGNSLSALSFLRDWPQSGSHFKCWAGVLIWRMSPDGIITGCDRLANRANSHDCRQENLAEALPRLTPLSCARGCMRTYTIEMNRLLSFDLATAFSLRKDI
jgi:MoaA/NifB/PqqE/SkfB family radical SAM enzyme